MLVSVIGICGLRVVWIYTVFRQVNTLLSLFISYPISWLLVIAAQSVVYILLYRGLTRRKPEVAYE
jgi:hypothetical protein